MTKFAPVLMGLAVAVLPLAPLAAATPIDGQWTNPKRNVVIDMSPCGPAWCGRVVSASAKVKKDAAEAGTPNIVGRDLLSGFKPDGKGGWVGRVFLPKRKMHATGTLRMVNANTIVVKGCAIAGMICKEQRWTRVS
nr:DUF2147 domain-containing protein [uncultured Sphingomonas sp.]